MRHSVGSGPLGLARVFSVVLSLGVVGCVGGPTPSPAVSSASATSAAPVAAVSGPAEGAVVGLAAGWNHTCAVTSMGAVKCWGWNDFGQLGDGTTTDRSLPVDVTGWGSGVSAVTAAGSRTCALTADGGVACWPGPGVLAAEGVEGLRSGVRNVTTGGGHTCAVTTDGVVRCWGLNEFGQLGDGTTTNRSLPVGVVGGEPGAQAVALGAAHTCALSAGGAVTCWGRNEFGQLGDGTTTDRATPVAVVGLGSGVQALTSWGEHTCALSIGGSVRCWGKNESGQLGDGTTSNRATPVSVGGLDAGAEVIAAGASHTCALRSEGAVTCWGGNDAGQLGDGTTTKRSAPVAVVGLGSGVRALAPGGYHTCALTAEGSVACWGHNNFGQLGDGSTRRRSTPGPVAGLP